MDEQYVGMVLPIREQECIAVQHYAIPRRSVPFRAGLLPTGDNLLYLVAREPEGLEQVKQRVRQSRQGFQFVFFQWFSNMVIHQIYIARVPDDLCLL